MPISYDSRAAISQDAVSSLAGDTAVISMMPTMPMPESSIRAVSATTSSVFTKASSWQRRTSSNGSQTH